MTDLTAVSLFAGIGGFDLALQRAGVDVVAAVEIDQAARGVLADRFPETTLFTDVCEVTGDQLRAAGFVSERGILTAGFPCQDLSVAGRRGGLGEGTRSGLYWEVDRLVAELRPAWVILENVPGLLSAVCPDPDSPVDAEDLPFLNEEDLIDGELGWDDDGHLLVAEQAAANGGRGACEGGCFPAHGGAMGLVLGSLADRGYGFAYRVLDAQYTGVPQRRRRVIFVGRAGADARGPVQVLLEPESSARDLAAGIEARPDVAGTLGSRAGGSRTTDLDGHGAYIVNSLTRSSVGGAGGADDNTAQAGHLVVSPLAGTLTAGQSRNGVRPAGRRSEDDVNLVAHTLRADPGGVGQGHNTNYVTETLRSHPRPGSNSNGAVVPMAFNPKTGGDMRIGYGAKPTALSSTVETAVQIEAAVRRLTPLETERLQGFPDRWTATSNGKPQADAPRYRQTGNAVAVPVVQWVVDRTVAVAAEERADTEAA